MSGWGGTTELARSSPRSLQQCSQLACIFHAGWSKSRPGARHLATSLSQARCLAALPGNLVCWVTCGSPRHMSEPEPESPGDAASAVPADPSTSGGLPPAEVESLECPVCLLPGTTDEPLLVTTCGHSFCRGCIERVLMTTKLINPTSAPCPVCRRELSLFDLQLPSSGAKLHEKDTSCAALSGMVFVQERTVGLASYHFPQTIAEGGSGDGGPESALPYLCYGSARVDECGWTLDDGSRPPARKFFEPGCHWHAATRTFHGTVLWEEGWYNSRRWDYVMQFSSEFRYICGGGVTMSKPGGAVEITPFGPRGLSYMQWHSSADEEAGPAGPPLSYHAGTLWGNVFVQGMRVGLASYHFASAATEDGSRDGRTGYISYEHPYCAQWPPLDDGSPVPARVPFTDVEWDEATRTFRGSVRWRDTYGTSWQGVDCWEYTMVFDADYTCVLRGSVMSTVEGVEEPHEQSRFGVSLIYLNAAAEAHFVQLLSRDSGAIGSEQGEGQGLRLALMPGLGLDSLRERTFQHFQEVGTPNPVTAQLLQLLPSAHVAAAAQRARQAGGGAAPPLVETVERLLYTEEAIEAIDEALAAEADESMYETEAEAADAEAGGAEGAEEEGDDSPAA